MNRRLASVFLLVLYWGTIGVQATDFYVAGPNSASPGLDSNPGTLSQPFLTLTKGQTAARTAGPAATPHIYIRGGAYYNVNIYLQGPQGGAGNDDSGETWQAYPGETVNLYGGQLLTGWTASSNGWWVASLGTYPSSSLNSSVNQFSGWQVRMLLVDGVMATRAQYPTSGASLQYTNKAGQPDQSYINWTNTDIPLSMASAATNAECMIDFSWNSETMQVAYITNSTKTIKFTKGVGVGFVDSVGLNYVPDIQTYRIYNTWEGMSTPGQFFWDKKAQLVFYYPIGGKNPNTSTIVVPTTDRIFYYYGYQYSGGGPYAGAGGPNPLTLSNLTLQVNALDVEPEGPSGFLLDSHALFAINENGAGGGNLSFLNCTMGWCAGCAIGGDYAYLTNVNLLNSTIEYCGAGGFTMRQLGPVTVSNNFIDHVGLISWQSPGVRANTNALIIQNSIFDMMETAYECSHSLYCRFILNSVSNTMQVNEDMGTLYQYFGPYPTGDGINQNGNIVQSNLFQSCGTNYNALGTDSRNFFRATLYWDECSSNVIGDHNEILGSPLAHQINEGRLLTISNSIFINLNYLPTNGSPQLAGLRINVSSDSTGPPNVFQQNVIISGTNVQSDNSGKWNSWGTNLVYSTFGPPIPTGATNTLQAGVPIQNPLANSYTPPVTFMASSPVTISNWSLPNLIQAPIGNGAYGVVIPITNPPAWLPIWFGH